MIRATTNGVLKGYRADLMNSFIKLNQSRDTVLTQRYFNSYAEDPAGAAQAFQMRRSAARIDAQHTVSSAVINKFNTGWSVFGNVVDDVDNFQRTSAFADVLTSLNDPTGAGRKALGIQMEELADGIVQAMNSKYGDNFVFAGADELNVPFTWEANEFGTRSLYYRGVPVEVEIPEPEYQYDADGNIVNDADGNPIVLNQDAIDAATEAQSDAMSKMAYMQDEHKFVDIGIGLQETSEEDLNARRLIEASAFDMSLQGIDFLDYGLDADGDPKNIVSIIYKMSEILQRCDSETGQWAEGTTDKEDFQRLAGKFEIAADRVSEKHVELDASTTFVNSNHTQLENTYYTINEQLMDLEKVDLADAITSFSWAQYCYNAALKMGNSILSESLMDYMNT